MVGFKKMEQEEEWQCDTCGQVYTGRLRWYSTQKKITDKLGTRFINVSCNGVFRRIK